MNKFILLFITLILATSSFVIHATNIPTDVRLETPTIRPRSLIELPFECSYQNGYVFITFTENIGQANVSVVNFSTGETITKSGSTASRYWIFPVSTSSCGYFIKVILASGEYYTAEL